MDPLRAKDHELAPLLAALALLLSACGGSQPTPTAARPTAAAVAISTAVSKAEEPTPRAASPVAGSGPHDVAPAVDGGVWYSAQRSGELGWLDPASGETRHVELGPGSAPHGVIVGPSVRMGRPGSSMGVSTPSCGSIRKRARCGSSACRPSGRTPT
jgi:streptogramin lyase